MRPSSIRSVVVLPAPFGPRKAVIEPGPTLAVGSSTATVAPKHLVRPRNSIVADICAIIPVHRQHTTAPVARLGLALEATTCQVSPAIRPQRNGTKRVEATRADDRAHIRPRSVGSCDGWRS